MLSLGRARTRPSRAVSVFRFAQRRLSRLPRAVWTPRFLFGVAFDMDKDFCLRLISLYAENNWLWDARDPNYTNRGIREDSWLDISRKLDMPVKDLKKKMESLLGSYRREKSREKKSLITGSGRDDIYKSSWYAYDSFAFLADRHDPGGTRETFDNDETNTNTSTVRAQSPIPTDGDDVLQTEQNDTQSRNSTKNPQTSKKRSKKRTAKVIDDISDETINDAYKLLQQCAASESQSISDTYSAFGQYIANELRKYDPLTLAYVKNDICGIILQADTGAYQQYRYNMERYDYRRLSSSSSSNEYPRSSSYSYTPIPTPSPLPPQSPVPPPPPPPMPMPSPSPITRRPPPLMTIPPLPTTSPPINSPPESESEFWCI